MISRKEVAKKLRAIPKQLEKERFYERCISYNIKPKLFEMLYEIACNSLWGDYDDIFIKLADLIDHTCKPVEAGNNIVCSECGADIYDDDLYCSRCGSRVVRRNGQV